MHWNFSSYSIHSSRLRRSSHSHSSGFVEWLTFRRVVVSVNTLLYPRLHVLYTNYMDGICNMCYATWYMSLCSHTFAVTGKCTERYGSEVSSGIAVHTAIFAIRHTTPYGWSLAVFIYVAS